MLERRVDGEPLQYVLGRWDFLGLDLLVDRRVLVPRPETEVVAQTAIDEAVRLGARRGAARPGWLAADTSYAVADLGTGSGAIALVLARELPDAEVWATDVSDDALAVARANVAGVGSAATRVRLRRGIVVRRAAARAARPAPRDRGEPAVHRRARGARPPTPTSWTGSHAARW